MSEQPLKDRRSDSPMQAILQMQHLISKNREAEMERYKTIIDGIAEVKISGETRHNELGTRIDLLSSDIRDFISDTKGFHESVKRAFPKDDVGNPDYDGHRGAHLAWIDNNKADKAYKRYVKRTIVAAIALGIILWVGMAAWDQFLLGPRQRPEIWATK